MDHLVVCHHPNKVIPLLLQFYYYSITSVYGSVILLVVRHFLGVLHVIFPIMEVAYSPWKKQTNNRLLLFLSSTYFLNEQFHEARKFVLFFKLFLFMKQNCSTGTRHWYFGSDPSKIIFIFVLFFQGLVHMFKENKLQQK